MSREAFISAALAMVGTEYAHEGRKPGIALDCIGLVVCAAKQAGRDIGDERGYSRYPRATHNVLERFLKVGAHAQEPAPGDVAVFWITANRLPHHVGVLVSKDAFVHTHSGAKRVLVQTLDSFWKRRLISGVDLWQR